MDFSEKELGKLKILADIYVQSKGIIIYSEEINPESKSNLQTIKELRDAFDHLIRVIYNKFNNESLQNEEYDYLNIEKALGHTYRAAFDAADGCALSLKEKILDTLSEYPSDIIVQAVPKYFEYKADIDKISEAIADHRSKKDSGNFSKNVLSKYIEDLDNLKEIHKIFQKNMKNVIELQLAIKDREKKNYKKHIILAIIILIVGFIISLILKHLFNIDL